MRAGAHPGDRVSFDAEDTRHLARVLRLGVGDTVQAVEDGGGHEFSVRLVEVGPHGAAGVVVDRAERRTESPLEIALVQALVKGDKLEAIIRMATELGVRRVAPVVTERTIARVAPAREAHRVERWRRVAREAAKQSGRAVVPDVGPPRPLAEWVASRAESDVLLCLWEAATEGLGAVLPAGGVRRIQVVVGPEGGLGEAEVDGLRAAGALIAGLGPRILRAETAGPAVVALLQSRYGDLGGAGR